MKRIIICGSRDWTDRQMIGLVMRARHRREPFVVIEGGARGVDRLARQEGIRMGLEWEEYAADWNLPLPRWQIGRERNQRMLDTGVDEVVAFKDGFNFKLDKGGTEHMIKIALLAYVPGVLYAHDLATPHTFDPDAHEAIGATPRVQRRDESGDTPTLF